MRLASFILCGLLSVTCHGAGVFYPTLSYTKQSIDNNGSTVSQSVLMGDFRGAYVFSNGFLVGANFNLGSGSGDGGFGLMQTAVGPLMGYSYGSWVFTVTYYLFANREDRAGGNTYRRRNASGFQIDGGYLVPIANSVQVGPTLSFHKWRFAGREVNGRDTEGWSYEVSDFAPYVGVVVVF